MRGSKSRRGRETCPLVRRSYKKREINVLSHGNGVFNPIHAKIDYASRLAIFYLR